MKGIYFILLAGILFLTGCSNASHPKDPIPEHETFTIKSVQVNEDRVINVWLPNAYKKTSDPMPVMYMADGGVQEDFPHIANTLAKLIEEEKIKPVILVGIENTQRRRDLTGFTEVEKDREIAPVVGGSEKFRAFINQELFPEIKKRYRITAVKSIIGESASGLFVMETFFLSPDMFDNYIAFDPSLWWNNNYLVKTANDNLSKFPTDKKVLWFAASNTTDIFPQTNKLAKFLKVKSPANLTWEYAYESTLTHATIFREMKEKALIWTLNKSN